MSVYVADLLADEQLRLSAVAGPSNGSASPISWVSTTELDDPVRFLRGGELVLTTALRRRSRDQWDRLVRDLTAVPVAAMCVGIGLVHDSVPAGLRQAAKRHGLVLLSSPVEVPFIQISRWVADRIFAEQYRRIREAALVQDEITAALLAGRGLEHVVPALARRLDAEVAVVGAAGEVWAQWPRGRSWGIDELVLATAAGPAEADAARPGDTAVVAYPLRVDDGVAGYLAGRGTQDRLSVLSAAANLVGMEVGRRQALLSGRRELLAQVLADVLHESVPVSDARRKLAAAGIDAAQEHRVVVASSARLGEVFRNRPLDLAALLRGETDLHPTCQVDGDIVVVVPGSADALAAAGALEGYLADRDRQPRIGVSGGHRGPRGIRIGYHEARHAQRQGTGVQVCRTLSLTGLLTSGADLPIAELATALLAPLRGYDAQHGAELEHTLRTYLEHDGSPAATCRVLRLHRNSLRYRLDQIEQLAGKRLSATEDRLELWLALRVLGPSEGSSPAR
ncbi:PucR family transcriptional regulator [Amycolatopsis benzoatilytica]|uniref:PucR family transcriptional regulator n=1 Tax=Amycolatopsis benzoatilytica TaxID=346045 RepID=UPI000382E458|nr:PucR family transcriptional regulator [Amycolatopsis benzoatilytica]